jgi:hypothetical protein
VILARCAPRPVPMVSMSAAEAILQILSAFDAGGGAGSISPSEGSIHPSLEELHPILPFRAFYHLLRISIKHVHWAAARQSRICRYQPQRQPPAVGVGWERVDNLCDDRFRPPSHRIKLKCEVARLSTVAVCKDLTLTPPL